MSSLTKFIDDAEYYVLPSEIEFTLFDYGVIKFFNHLNSVFNLDTVGLFGKSIPDGSAIQTGMYELTLGRVRREFAHENDKESMSFHDVILKEIDKIKDNENFWKTLHSENWLRSCISAACGDRFESYDIRICHTINKFEWFSDFVHCHVELHNLPILDVVKFYKFTVILSKIYRELASNPRYFNITETRDKYLYFDEMQLYVSNTIISLSDLPVISKYLESKYLNTIEWAKKAFECVPEMQAQFYDVFTEAIAYKNNTDSFKYEIFSIFVKILYQVSKRKFNYDKISRIESLAYGTRSTLEFHQKFHHKFYRKSHYEHKPETIDQDSSEFKIIEYLKEKYGSCETLDRYKNGIRDVIEQINNDATIPFKLEYGELVQNEDSPSNVRIHALVKFQLVPFNQSLTVQMIHAYIEYYLAIYRYLEIELNLNLCEIQLCCGFAASFITEYDDLVELNKEMYTLYDSAYYGLLTEAGIHFHMIKAPCSECFDSDVTDSNESTIKQ